MTPNGAGRGRDASSEPAAEYARAHAIAGFARYGMGAAPMPDSADAA
jgi:hypothetical protein